MRRVSQRAQKSPLAAKTELGDDYIEEKQVLVAEASRGCSVTFVVIHTLCLVGGPTATLIAPVRHSRVTKTRVTRGVNN